MMLFHCFSRQKHSPHVSKCLSTFANTGHSMSRKWGSAVQSSQKPKDACQIKGRQRIAELKLLSVLCWLCFKRSALVGWLQVAWIVLD